MTTESSLTTEQQALLDAALISTGNLEQALVSDEPQIRTFLREINSQLRQFPELLYLLPVEKRAPIYKGMLKLSEVEVVKAEAKKRGRANSIMDDGTKVADNLSFLDNL